MGCGASKKAVYETLKHSPEPLKQNPNSSAEAHINPGTAAAAPTTRQPDAQLQSPPPQSTAAKPTTPRENSAAQPSPSNTHPLPNQHEQHKPIASSAAITSTTSNSSTTKETPATRTSIILPPIDQRKSHTLQHSNGTAAPSHASPIDANSAERLKQHLYSKLKGEDSDDLRCLHHKTVRRLLLGDTADLPVRLTRVQSLRLLAEADQNGRGMVFYERFLKNAIEAFKHAHSTGAFAVLANTALGSDVTVIRGLWPADVAELLLKSLHEADYIKTNRPTALKGTVSRYNFRRLLETSDIGMSTKEINAVMAMVEEDELENVELQQAVPLVFEVLETMEKCYLREQRRSAADWEHFLERAFEKRDLDRTGQLSHTDVRELLLGAELGIMPVQIVDLIADLEEDPQSGTIFYKAKLPQLVAALQKVFDEHEAVQRYNQMKKVGDQPSLSLSNTKEFEGKVIAILTGFDDSGSGLMTRLQLRRAFEASMLPPKEVNALLCLVDDKGKQVEYMELVPLFTQVMAYYERQRVLCSK